MIKLFLLIVVAALICFILGFLYSIVATFHREISPKKILLLITNATLLIIMIFFLDYSFELIQPEESFGTFLKNILNKDNPFTLVYSLLTIFANSLLFISLISTMQPQPGKNHSSIGNFIKKSMDLIKELTLGNDFNFFWRLIPSILFVSLGFSFVFPLCTEALQLGNESFGVNYPSYFFFLYLVFLVFIYPPTLLQLFKKLILITKKYVILPASTERIYKRLSSWSARLMKRVIAFILLFSAWLIFHSITVFLLQTFSAFFFRKPDQFISIWDAFFFVFGQMSGVSIEVKPDISMLLRGYSLIIGLSSIFVLMSAEV